MVRRLAARVLDIGIVAVALVAPILASDPFKSRGFGLGYGLYMVAWAGFGVIVLWPMYEMLGARRGATFGKNLMGLRVTGAGGALPSAKQAVRRTGLVIASMEVLLIGVGVTFGEHNPTVGLGVCGAVVAPPLIALMRGRSTWVDRLTGTSVTRNRRARPRSRAISAEGTSVAGSSTE